MAVRSGMAAIITRLRGMVGDTAGSEQAWTDQELQDALDTHRCDVRYMNLTDAPTIASGGATTYVEFYSPGYTDWETSPTIVNSSYTTVTPSVSELNVGHWTFAADQNGNLPLMIVGNSYDLSAAAVQVLTAWAAKVALELDYEDSAITATWELKRKAMEALVKLYSTQQRAGFGSLVRQDIDGVTR